MNDTLLNESWTGQSFLDWCTVNDDEDRKIHYTLISHSYNGEVETEKFTTDDTVDLLTIIRLRGSTIEDIRLEDDEWHFTLEFYQI